MKNDKKHAGGRPALSEEKKKSSTVKVRVSGYEMDAIKSKADAFGVTVPQYLRDAALNHEVKKMIITNNRDLNLLTADVNKIGCNLNQIARRLNASKSYRECFGVMPIHEDEVVILLKVLHSQLSKIGEHLQLAREEFSREQTGKISDYEYEKMKTFWYGEDGGETDGDDLYPSA